MVLQVTVTVRHQTSAHAYVSYRKKVYEGATENAGQENDGQKCNTQNALIDH